MPATFGGRVVTDPAALATLLRSPQGPVYRRIVEDGAAIRLVARRNVGVSKLDPVPRRNPHRPGTLRDAIVSRVVNAGAGGITVAVGVYSVPYALFHHEPQPAYKIPRNGPMPAGKFLVFAWPKMGAGTFYAKQVTHPAWPGNPFLRRALIDTMGVRYGQAGYR